MPTHTPVALATLSDQAFSDPAWLFEIKWDGERALARIVNGAAQFWSRSGRNITAEYPELSKLPDHFRAHQAILDGEIVVLDESGRSDFSRIQPRFSVINPSAALIQKAPVTYYVFDLLYCDGYDLRQAPLESRKELLRALLKPTDRIRYSDYVLENGRELYEVAQQRGLEGIIAKQRSSPYPGRRSTLWLKIKLLQDLDAVIGGWTAPRKTRDYFGALLVGLYEGHDLIHVGGVGTGFNHETLRDLHQKMLALETRTCPFQAIPKVSEPVRWVKPELVARVKYHHWTNDRKLRAPVFLGFQEDRSPRDCTFKSQTAPPAASPNAPVNEVSASQVHHRRNSETVKSRTRK